MNYYLDVLKKYAVFNGRARRKEYWMFFLFNVVIGFVLGFIDSIIGTKILALLYSLVVLIPGIAVGVRRFHDTNHSGWWWLIGLVPIVGVIILIVLFARDGQSGENRYGPSPKVFSNGGSFNDTGRTQPPNQELIDYVKTSLAHGHSRDVIKQTLLNNGWQENDVDQALSQIKS